MRSNIIIYLAGFISSATAIITGIAVPSAIALNSTIPVTLTTSNYIQTVADISVAFALNPNLDQGYLGAGLLESFYLGPTKSNILSNITFDIPVPSSLSDAKFFTAIITSLYGASHGPITTQYHVPITIGAETSDDMITSTSGFNVCMGADMPVARDTSCFPTATTSIIQSSVGFADALIGNIDHGDNSTGRANLGELTGYLGDLTRAIVPGCSNPTPAPWPPLGEENSKARAIQMLRQVEDALNALQGDVSACEVGLAKSVLCQVLKIVDGVSQYYVQA